jgi:membrane-bound metal-dependent hydrolase YbcI (DUF457 family)
MAGFKTHITVSTVLGVGFGATGAYMGLPWESAVIAGGLCGIGGMMPDIDSDSGVPYRESMCFAAAIIPMLLLSRFAELGLNYEQMVLAAGGTYVFVRFGIGKLLKKYTVHRGMFHSIPAALIFAGLVFLFSASTNLQLRYFKSAGMFLGVMSHLTLDEIYSVEWKGGRWRFKKSFGTALKLWGDNSWANFSTYSKLVLVVMMIMSEPMVMEHYGQPSPMDLAGSMWQGTFQQDPNMPVTAYMPGQQFSPPAFQPSTNFNPNMMPPGFAGNPNEIPQTDRTVYDTFRRIARLFKGETK